MAVALSVVLGACSLRAGKPPRLDSVRAEGTLRRWAAERYPVEVGDARCPSGVEVENGGTFECTVEVASQSLTIKATQEDDEGNVRFEPTEAVVDVRTVERSLAARVKEQTGVAARAVCARGVNVLVIAPKRKFECQVRDEDGRRYAVVVTVDDVIGNVSWDVEEAGAGGSERDQQAAT